MKRTKTIAYLRVSTTDQDIQKNKNDILHLANEKGLGKVEWIEEQASGRISWRKREIAQVMEDLQSGDNLVVSELSRLGRSMLECMEILSIASQKKINIYAVKGNWQLDQSIQSKILAMAFAMASEIERDLISQRTKEALAAKKRAGIKLGRPKGSGTSKLDKHRPEIEALLETGSTQRYIASRFNTTESNLSRWMKKHGMKRKKQSSSV
ncbi:MAG: recombinase family protein [Planctomycetaceae bacterium]|nr:recombinase family protein [Planctomycetaceae bacterium]